MIVQIDDKTRICGTSTCWQLEYLGQRKGQPYWEPKRYFGTFRQALERATDDEIRTHPATSLSEAITAVSDINRQYGELFGLHLPAAEVQQSKIRRKQLGMEAA